MKKILSIALALVLMLSCLAVANVSAAEDTTIYFQVPDDWNNYKNVFCYIWEYDGDKLMGWQVKAGKCEDLGDKLYSYDVSKVGGLEEGKTYCVIFSVNTGIQTYDLFLSTDCYGDTAYCDGTKFENPTDSNKTAITAYWKNQDKTVYGPTMGVTSIGNVVGSCLAPDETPESLFTKFITGPNLLSAQISSGKDDQGIIDDLAKELGLSPDAVESLINESGVTLNWEKSAATTTSPDEATPDESTKDEGSTINLYLGDADLSGGTITVKDATIIQKHIAGFDVAINLDCADADQNGIVNVKDATTIQKFIAGLPVDAAIGLLLGQLPDKESGLDSRIFGTWEGTVDAASVINMLLPMFSEDPLVLEHINIETCPVKQIYTFKDDGTYSITVNEAALEETITAVKVELKGDIENFLKAYAEQNNLSMTPEQMIQAYGYDSIDAFIEETIHADMVAENTAPQEGTYNTIGNMLITQELLNTHETYTIDGDTLTIDIGTENFFPEMYPFTLTKVK